MTLRPHIRLLLSSGILLVTVLSQLLCSAVQDDGSSLPSCQTDCSWTSYETKTEAEESFQCSITRSTTSLICPMPITTRPSSVDERPQPVTNLMTEFYAVNLTNDDEGDAEVMQQICLRVKFSLDPSTAKNVQAISVILYSLNYLTQSNQLCHRFQFSSNLSYCSVLDGLCDYYNKRLFMTDCMCDLIPEGSYRLNVKTLPEDDLTDSPYSTIVTTLLDVPGCTEFPLDYHCPRGLMSWVPRHSVSYQEPDYSSMTTCFSLPPENAITFDVFLYAIQAEQYHFIKDRNLSRATVSRREEFFDDVLHELACTKFQGLNPNTTYLPALRLKDASEPYPLPLRYLYSARLFLFENPCHRRPCGDVADGICVPNLSKYECECNEASIFNGETCRRDVDNPVVTSCPSSFEVPAAHSNCSAIVSWTEINVTDNSGNVSLIRQSHSPHQLFDIGDTLVEYEYVDRAENRALCSFTVSVKDEEQPELHQCPGTISERLREGETHRSVSWNIQATDNCGRVNSDFPLRQNSQVFPSGKSEILINVWDTAGNNRTCQITVVIHAPPFNYIRPAIIFSCISLLAMLVICVVWRHRGKLKAFKSFLKTHRPYSLSVDGNLSGPASANGARNPSQGERVNRWLTKQESSIPETLSQEDVTSVHLLFEPVALICQERTPMNKLEHSEISSASDSRDESQESDHLVWSGDSVGRESEVDSTSL